MRKQAFVLTLGACRCFSTLLLTHSRHHSVSRQNHAQNDFDAGTVTISAEYITATPAGTDTGAAVTGSTNTAPVALDQTPALSVQVTLDKPTISQKGRSAVCV